MKATNIVNSDNLNKGKYAQLEEQARLLGKLRASVWQQFGGLSAANLSDRKIRDEWVKQGRSFGVPANAWKETLRDVCDDIKLYREAAKEKVRRYVRDMNVDAAEKKRLRSLLKSNKYQEDNLLRRLMRKHFRHGQTSVSNQIILRSDNVKTYELNGKCWLKVPSLIPRQLIHIPLNCTMDYAPKGTCRLILREGRVEVHYLREANAVPPCGDQVVGIDKGYTETLVDSDGDTYGAGLGKEITSESDYLTKKYQRRNKLRALARKKSHKRAAIEKNNLGRVKLDKRQRNHTIKLKTLIYGAVHKLNDKAGMVVAEDLTKVFAGRQNRGSKYNRRMNTWVKGMIAQALENVSQRRGSTLHLANAAYTSQADSFNNGLLTGTRVGDKFYRENGEVVQADHNAARNVLARLDDHEIGRWTPFKRVKAILQARTDRYRLELTNLGSSYTLGNETLTECELVLDHV